MLLLKDHARNSSVPMIAFAPDSQRLASVGLDHTVRLWDLPDGTSHVVIRTSSQAVAFSPCGEWLVFGNYNQVARVQLGDDRVTSLGGKPSMPRVLAFSPQGEYLVSGGHQVQVYGARRWKVLPSWRDSPPSCTALAFHPRGEQLALASSVYHFDVDPQAPRDVPLRRRERSITLLDPRTGQQVVQLDGPRHDVTALAYSPCGGLLAATSGPTLWVWRVPAGEVVLQRAIDARHVQSCAFSPDGRTLATAHNDALVRTYETTTWTETGAYDWGIGPLVDVVFAPDGMKAAASSKRGQIVVWDVE